MGGRSYFNTLPSECSSRQDLNAPLPPLPRTASNEDYSPNRITRPSTSVTSPFDDHAYPESEAHHGMSTRDFQCDKSRPPMNPFADSYDIQVETQRPKADIRYYPRENNLESLEYGEAPPDQRTKKQKKNRFRHTGTIPWVVYILTTIQTAVFIAELVRNAILTGSPIEIHPQFNPMIGPSYYLLINMGARYVPCMRNQNKIQNNPLRINWPCPDQTTNTSSCTLSELCGFSGVPNPQPNGSLDAKPAPNQWFRFITPIFLHAGIIHIGFNMLLQMLLGKDMERQIGPIRFTIVYFSSGIFGFVLGANFSQPGLASTGASGALFGIIALTLIDLFYTWSHRKSPYKDLLFILLDIVISFVLGLLPGVDNFAHIGGFLMGLALGVCLLHSPPALRRKTGELTPPGTRASYAEPPPLAPHVKRRTTDFDIDAGGTRNHAADYATPGSDFTSFFKSPLGFFSGRKALWWLWWLLRASMLVGVSIAFIVLLDSFYRHHDTTCSWCRNLSCLPVNGWCDIGDLNFTSQNGTKPVRRAAKTVLGL